jgi:N-acetylated-alpha-linked acidic dipeptidase
VQQRLDFTRATNVIGWLEGAELPDEWVILGSHYDPWGFGAHDPNGGTAMLLTLADALGTHGRAKAAGRAGASPSPTGMPRSTASSAPPNGWSTTATSWRRTPIAYINADGSVTGPATSMRIIAVAEAPISTPRVRCSYPEAAARYTTTG